MAGCLACSKGVAVDFVAEGVADFAFASSFADSWAACGAPSYHYSYPFGLAHALGPLGPCCCPFVAFFVVASSFVDDVVDSSWD